MVKMVDPSERNCISCLIVIIMHQLEADGLISTVGAIPRVKLLWSTKLRRKEGFTDNSANSNKYKQSRNVSLTEANE